MCYRYRGYLRKKIVSVAFFPKAVYVRILSGFTILTVPMVPKVFGNVVCV